MYTRQACYVCWVPLAHFITPVQFGAIVRAPTHQLCASCFPGLANCSTIQYLSLANNNLTGTLPAEWGDASYPLHSSLQTLRVDGNNLTGSLPSSWTGLTALSCWSVKANPLLCGAYLSSSVCTDYSGTNIGECVRESASWVCITAALCAATSLQPTRCCTVSAIIACLN